MFVVLLQIVALREQNAHIQRKVASGDGGEDILEGSEAQQKVHGKVSLIHDKTDIVFKHKEGHNSFYFNLLLNSKEGTVIFTCVKTCQHDGGGQTQYQSNWAWFKLNYASKYDFPTVFYTLCLPT